MERKREKNNTSQSLGVFRSEAKNGSSLSPIPCKVDREKKRGCARAPDIRTVVRDQIASFDDLRIVEGVFHVVVQVFAAHFGARVRVSILERVFCRRRTSFEPFFFIYKIRETFGEKVASFTSRLRRRADRNRMIHARRRKAAVFEYSVDARWWSFFRCGSRGGRQRGVSGEKQFFCGEKPLPFGEEIGPFFLDRKENAKYYCEKSRKDGFWRLVSRTKSMTKI